MSNKSIMIVGGGSGGHLTPVVAVAESIKKLDGETVVIHVGQKGEGLDDVTDNLSIDQSYSITAGKFRRYHGKSFLSHILDVKTLLLNFRDFFRFVYGTMEAWRLLGRVRPTSIMLKGGFVSVPVGYAARMRRIPYITHDSDAVPGLANRLTATHAVFNTTALPASIYPYDQSKTKQVGIPIRKEFQQVKHSELSMYKEKIGIDPSKTVIFSVGGGLGAQRVNHALVQAIKQVFSKHKNVVLVHLTGKKLYDETLQLYQDILTNEELDKIKLIDFTTSLFEYSAAADIVITRAGATNIAEFAAQAKTCVVVPNPLLTGGQQIHNAKILEEANAAIILNEESLSEFGKVLISTIELGKDKKEQYASSLHGLAVYDSADKIANMLLNLK